jgi:threonine synthase
LRAAARRINILGATSGDTGSAAEYAMRGKQGVKVFMLSPHGRMSPFQQAQMFSLQDANIHNIAVEGVFDDCQDIVKAVSNDLEFKRRWKIGTVNSINWARLLAQVVYYFAGYFQATRSNDQQVSFAVPSGNFGNICAGHVARMMGLPIRRLVLATNENNVLDEFFRTGNATACEAAPRRTRPPARRWTSARPRTSSASCSTCSAAMRGARRRCSTTRSSRRAPSASRRRSSRASPNTASSPAAARMPIGWPRSATSRSVAARSSTRTRPMG